MNKNLLWAAVVSTAANFFLVFGLESFDFKARSNYAKNIGESKTKVSIRILDTVQKINNTQGQLKKKITKSDKQKIASSGSKSKESSGNQEILSKYLSLIRSKIVLNKYKTRAATRLKQTGVVKISFKVLAPNIISEVKILKASDFEQLNYSALKTIESIEDIPNIPKELDLLELSAQVDITYQ